MDPIIDVSRYGFPVQQPDDEASTYNIDSSAPLGPFSNAPAAPMEQGMLAYGFSGADLPSQLWVDYQQPYGLSSNTYEAQPPGIAVPWHEAETLTPYLCEPSMQINQEPTQVVSPNSAVSQHEAPFSKQPGPSPSQALRWKPPSTPCSPTTKRRGTSRLQAIPSPPDTATLAATKAQDQLEHARAHRRRIKSQSRQKTKTTWANLVSESVALQDQNADLAAKFRALGEQILFQY
ncbi:hypothetical protein QBC40DRAFT_258249 [Triangularia verruculosa]|uniref:Uncharacterized protein n=1 Tax=Triangularia verruculosa TaxID=2587418 RepID=A0AAN6XE71_9PEZI|nr:hypothetical protein QBC40DRAFT_258249 [Triangularia verruculosa]